MHASTNHKSSKENENIDTLKFLRHNLNTKTPNDKLVEKSNDQLKKYKTNLLNLVEDLNLLLVNKLQVRDKYKNEQDAKMADLEDIQSLVNVVGKETRI